MTETSRLVFVYNADSGIFNTVSDIAHKILSPQTYQCHLCELTHGYFTVRDEWLGFLDTLDIETEFLHRDEFSRLPTAGKLADTAYPAIFLRQGKQLSLWMSRDDIAEQQSSQDLARAIRLRLQQSGMSEKSTPEQSDPAG